MRVLVTSSRFPHALGEIRKLGEGGHSVYAADTFRSAPGSHSKHVVERFVTAAPALDTRAFVDDVEDIVRSRRIDLVLPSFEEAMYLAGEHARFADITELFCPPLPTLARLHDKHAFVSLARSLGLAVPGTRIARTRDELRSAVAAFPQHIARPTFSRGGVRLLTNAGPLAGRVSIDECDPTPEAPWIVQEFVHGRDVCSFSVVQHGRVVAHCTYEHPKTIEHAGGIYFESIDEPDALRAAQTIAAALDYHGQISFDFIRTSRGLVVLECNPRPTAGLLLMDAHALSDAIVDPTPRIPHVVPPGMREQIAVALVRDMFRSWREIPADLRFLLSGAEDVYAKRGDARPMLYCLLTYHRVLAYRKHVARERRGGSDLVASQFFDVAWDGDEAWNAQVADAREADAPRAPTETTYSGAR